MKFLALVEYAIEKQNGSTSRGENNGRAKIRESDVCDIFFDQRPRKEIAKAYGIGIDVIKNIRSGRTWKHVARTRRKEK